MACVTSTRCHACCSAFLNVQKKAGEGVSNPSGNLPLMTFIQQPRVVRFAEL